MSHQEKQEIFERYAESVGYSSWSRLFNSYIQNSHYLQLHIFAACDLVQAEQQKRIADNTKMLLHDGFHKSNKQTKYYQIGADNLQIDKSSIINPENLIK